jgi:hypothetical protein
MSNENVEECISHPCKFPLLKKPVVFLEVSEELLYSVRECIVLLCGRSGEEMCSKLLRSIWNSLLRHIAAVLEDGETTAGLAATGAELGRTFELHSPCSSCTLYQSLARRTGHGSVRAPACRPSRTHVLRGHNPTHDRNSGYALAGGDAIPLSSAAC